MDNNTVTLNTNTETVATSQVEVVSSTKARPGRKPIRVADVSDKDFTIAYLEKLNPNVKPPTIRSHVARHINAGIYTISGTRKSGLRGKPANIYHKA